MPPSSSKGPLRTLATLCAVSVMGLSTPASASNELDLLDELPSSRVIGGATAKPCAWPSLILIVSTPPNNGGKQGACSGTLVHPELVLYAAHCGPADIVIVGENSTTDAKIFKKEKGDFVSTKINPRWKGVNNIPEDYAFVRLKEPLTGVPNIPVAEGCERAQGEKRGKPINVAGYSSNESPKSEDVLLRWGPNKISSIGNSVIEIVNTPGDAMCCVGDSGGPTLFKLPDGSWRTMGILSTGIGGCGDANGRNRYTHITPRVIQWVNKESGLDITPCFDDAGKPTPSPECDAHMAYSGNPSAPQGTRKKMCVDSPAIPTRSFCKIPESGLPDPEDSGKPEGSDKPGDPKEPDDPEKSKKTPEPEDTNNSEDTKQSEEPEKPDETEKSEGTATSEPSEQPKDTENTGDTAKSEDNKESKEPEASNSDTEPPSGNGCDVAGRSSPNSLVWMFMVLLGAAGIRRRQR